MTFEDFQKDFENEQDYYSARNKLILELIETYYPADRLKRLVDSLTLGIDNFNEYAKFIQSSIDAGERDISEQQIAGSYIKMDKFKSEIMSIHSYLGTFKIMDSVKEFILENPTAIDYEKYPLDEIFKLLEKQYKLNKLEQETRNQIFMNFDRGEN